MREGDNQQRFAITRLTKDRVPTLPFVLMKEFVLGKNYDLSLVIIGDDESTELNIKYRKKSYTPNVLSFPIDKTHGEIFLNMKQARREYIGREMKLKDFVTLLFIHSLYHLKGMQHGSKMEAEEKRAMKKFGVTEY